MQMVCFCIEKYLAKTRRCFPDNIQVYTVMLLLCNSAPDSFSAPQTVWSHHSLYVSVLFLVAVLLFRHCSVAMFDCGVTVWSTSSICCLRSLCRAQDLKAKKHHIPVVDRSPLEPPPVVVVVVGPPRVGKSTLIRCLIKNFTRQKLSDICGPITIVSGKSRSTTHWSKHL